MDARLLNTAHTRVTRLQYMYQHQMGCLHTFEHRRRAIAVARGCLESAVSDTDVVEDVLAGVSHGGAVHEYLRHGQIGVVIGDTAFVHGGITRENMGFVPARVNHDRLALGPSPGYETLGSKCVQEWIEDLNAYVSQCPARTCVDVCGWVCVGVRVGVGGCSRLHARQHVAASPG